MQNIGLVFERNWPLSNIVIDHCVSSERQDKKLSSGQYDFVFQDIIALFSTKRWNRRQNDLTHLKHSWGPRSQPYRYKYSYLLRRYNLHRFCKDQKDIRWYLKKRNKWWNSCNLPSNSNVYIQTPDFMYEKKMASNFVLELLHFFFKRSHTGTSMVTFIDIWK